MHREKWMLPAIVAAAMEGCGYPCGTQPIPVPTAGKKRRLAASGGHAVRSKYSPVECDRARYKKLKAEGVV